MTARIKKGSTLTNTVRKGFTLIELLIVIAILGVLAVVVLVAINPVQQLARTRDSGRKSTITQIGHALQAYYTSRNGLYPTENATWLDSLVTAGELSSTPGAVAFSVGTAPACGTAQNGWCYDYDATAGTAVVSMGMESDIEQSKCAANTAYFVFSTADGRSGLVCSAGAPAAGAQTWNSVQ